MISAEKLDKRITIQRKGTATDEFGEELDVWTSIAHNRPAGRRPLGGSERFQADQFVAREQVQWRIRFSSVVQNITPRDRIVYPVPDDPDENEPAISSIYDILAVNEIGRRDTLQIITARRME